MIIFHQVGRVSNRLTIRFFLVLSNSHINVKEGGADRPRKKRGVVYNSSCLVSEEFLRAFFDFDVEDFAVCVGGDDHAVATAADVCSSADLGEGAVEEDALGECSDEEVGVAE